MSAVGPGRLQSPPGCLLPSPPTHLLPPPTHPLAPTQMQRYAQQEAAAQEERGYLHCAAMRFELQGQAVQVVCKPEHGAEFVSPGFQSLFDSWLPASLEQETGPWFPENRLLRSELVLP